MRKVASRHDAGTAVVEFAVIVPVFLLLVFGMLDFGRAMNYKNSATQLANEAARFLSVNRDPVTGNPPTCASVKSYLQTQADTPEMASMLNKPNTLEIDTPGGNTVGNPVAVTVSVDFSWLPYLTNQALGGSTSMTLRGLATMRLEQPLTAAGGSC
jgi:Flp pilus assembly protein TadG